MRAVGYFFGFLFPSKICPEWALAGTLEERRAESVRRRFGLRVFFHAAVCPRASRGQCFCVFVFFARSHSGKVGAFDVHCPWRFWVLRRKKKKDIGQ